MTSAQDANDSHHQQFFSTLISPRAIKPTPGLKRWLGHVSRMEDNRRVKSLLYG